eukprot:466259_1
MGSHSASEYRHYDGSRVFPSDEDEDKPIWNGDDTEKALYDSKLIDGYIREIQSNVLMDQIIPDIINSICNKHYHIPGPFSPLPLAPEPSQPTEEELTQIEHAKRHRLQKKRKKLLKKWMLENDVYVNDLFEFLIINKVTSTEKIKSINRTTFDDIARKFRVNQFEKVRNRQQRKEIDQLLLKLEQVLFVKNSKKNVQDQSVKEEKKTDITPEIQERQQMYDELLKKNIKTLKRKCKQIKVSSEGSKKVMINRYLDKLLVSKKVDLSLHRRYTL